MITNILEKVGIIMGDLLALHYHSDFDKAVDFYDSNSPLPSTGQDGVSYVKQEGSNYFYYKWYKNEWHKKQLTEGDEVVIMNQVVTNPSNPDAFTSNRYRIIKGKFTLLGEDKVTRQWYTRVDPTTGESHPMTEKTLSENDFTDDYLKMLLNANDYVTNPPTLYTDQVLVRNDDYQYASKTEKDYWNNKTDLNTVQDLINANFSKADREKFNAIDTVDDWNSIDSSVYVRYKSLSARAGKELYESIVKINQDIKTLNNTCDELNKLKVSRMGDTMEGALTLPRLNIFNTNNYLTADASQIQMVINNNVTLLFKSDLICPNNENVNLGGGINLSGSVFKSVNSLGFYKKGSSNDYLLLGAGGHKAVSDFAPASHTHPWDQVTDKPAQATRWPSWNEVTDKPTEFNPVAHTHNKIVSRGNVTAESGVAGRPAVDGLSMSQAYNNGYPTQYGNVISLRGTGDGQILVGWSGSDGQHAPVYVRSKRDNITTANWSGWAQFYTTAHKPSPSDIGAAPSSHTHSWDQVTSKPSTATRWPSWGEVTGKPSEFTPSSHTHGQYLDKNTTSSQSITGYCDFKGGAGNSGSDMRFKINISKFEDVLDKISSLDIFNYRWNKSGEERDTFGLNATQIKELFPRMWHQREDEYKTEWLEYDRTGVIALKAIQELIIRVDELKKLILSK